MGLQMMGDLMLTKLRVWLGRRSLVAQAMIMAVFWAGAWFAIMASIKGPTWGLFVGSLVGGLFYGLFSALFLHLRQRRNGGRTLSGEIEKAIKARAVPEEAAPEEWLPLLERKRRSEHRMLWVGPLEFGLFTVLGVYLMVTEPMVPFWWFGTALFIAFGVAIPIWTRRRGSRIDALIVELKGSTAH